MTEISRFDEQRDSFAEVTALVNRAYASLANLGFNYVAATQGEDVTRSRITTATECWVSRNDGRIVGTISYYNRHRYRSEPAWHKRADVGHFGLFAVDPDDQSRGIGLALMAAVQQRALADGKAELSCDTAEEAHHLVRFYRKHGYRIVGHHRWPHANYRSVVLSKSLARPPVTTRTLIASDIERIKEIDRASFSADEQYAAEVYEEMLQSGCSLVALEGEVVTGYAFVDPRMRVRSLAVHPAFRRRGHGRALLRDAIAKGEVDLLVEEANAPAIALYESLGFQRAEMCPTKPPRRRMLLPPASG